MKKLSLICMSALLMLAVSCKKDKKDEIENAGSGFRATVESHEGTGKTHLDGLAVKWDSGDAILVKSSTCTTPKRFTTTGTDASANFDAAESLPTNFYAQPYTGYYPADKFSGDQLTLPPTQQYDENNTFANGANPMAATSSETLLPFKNVCGVLKLQLYSATACQVQSISITSNNDEQLCGTGAVTLTDGVPALGTLSNGGSTLTLDMGEGGKAMSTSESAPTAYYFVVPVGTLGQSFTVKVTDTEGGIWTKTANAPQNLIARSKITAMPELAVTTTKPIEFTVDADGTTVSFSPGNLQYLGSSDGTGTWRFAEHQWDYMGDGPNTTTGNKGNVDLGADYAGKYNTGSGSAGGSETEADKAAARDLFGWGCTGYQDTRSAGYEHWYQTNYQPYSTSSSTVNTTYNYFGYGPDYVSSPYYNLTVENKSDWGCVTGLPSAGEGKSWRTLSKGEWLYLLNTSNASSGARTDVNRFAKAMVNGVKGLLVFPDGYNGTAISGITGIATVNSTGASYPSESIPTETWASMESAGVVFLPAAGIRNGTSVSNVGSYSFYWSSSYYNSNYSYSLYFYSGYVYPYNNYYRYFGFSVRLVSEN